MQTHRTPSDSERRRPLLIPRPRQHPTALIVSRRVELARALGRLGFDCRAAETAEKAWKALDDDACDMAFVDPHTFEGEDATRIEDLAEGTRPIVALCRDRVGPDAVSDGDALRFSRLGRLVGASHVMQEVYARLLRSAPRETTVFLVGESGTGKELAAEILHRGSRRADGVFLAVNCGALAPSLIESELFGHEKGSFTGAHRLRPGLFELARGGTLFLDEITEMPHELQVKLLRVLESGSVRRVGASHSVEVDVRVIAATNRDPEQAVAEGALREDLFYRLFVLPIDIPPLRERSEDIPAIADLELRRLNRFAPDAKRWRRESLEVLRDHDWPGNVRELKNALARAFILADEEVSPEALSSWSAAPPPRENGEEPGEPRISISVGTPIAEMERRLILTTLEHCEGRKQEAASVLGISVKTLYNRLSVYRAEKAG